MSSDSEKVSSILPVHMLVLSGYEFKFETGQIV